jgi:phosphoribosylglycinamide formyltransferase 2
MIELGTATTASCTKILLLGSGELGKEVALEAMRLGVEVVACDRYDHAPAMQVAHRRHVFSMLDGAKLREVILAEKPDFVVPEVEAIATDVLVELERDGVHVVPTANAARLTMNREGIRRLAAEELGLPTSGYRFAGTLDEYRAGVEAIGLPCFVKPVMSSSGKGQSYVKRAEDVDAAWHHAQSAGRAGAGRVIIESRIDFDFEITLLTVRHVRGTSFCPPIGHRQVDGDYHESWQPQPMSSGAYARSCEIATAVTNALGGRGLFGVELFVKGDDVWFSEVSPRPHDTGMVTMISQDLSEFALHVRAVLGLPIPTVHLHGPSASYVILGDGHSKAPRYRVDPRPLEAPDTGLRLFGKPEVAGHRRVGVALARGASIDDARAKALAVARGVEVVLDGDA